MLKKVATEKDNWSFADATQDAQSITREWIPVNQKMIEGVTLTEMRPVPASYGYLTEIFRSEWCADNAAVGQVFMSCLKPGGLSAWHAHAETTDRLFVAAGALDIVLYDNRPGSSTREVLNKFRIATVRPALLVVPPQVWHGVHNRGHEPAILVNAVDIAYRYESPDHWRLASDSPEIPYTFRDY